MLDLLSRTKRGNASETSVLPVADGAFPAEIADLTPEATISLVLEHAVKIGASDLFFACNENNVEVSVRDLGIVRQLTRLPLALGFRCTAVIRAAAGMKHAEKRHPQDGRWSLRTSAGEFVDLRLNTIPTLYGESFAIRLLRRNSTLQKFENLGFVGPQLGIMHALIGSPSGLILVTGPTGSGKTTTLYACLHALNDGRKRIHTIEDPVEYSVEGLRQTQVEEGTGAGFHELLRAVLRQGPDVIMIGEIRDRIAAEVAIRAANSGQLVFATLHAPVAAAAVTSMLGLGIAPHQFCTSLLAIISQRLLRTLDPKQAVPFDLSSSPGTFEEIENWLEPGDGKVVYSADSSNGSVHEGFIDRTGLFEILTMSPALRRMILETRPASQIAHQAVTEGMLDFRRASLLKVARGLTSFEEMNRVVPTGEQWIEE